MHLTVTSDSFKEVIQASSNRDQEAVRDWWETFVMVKSIINIFTNEEGLINNL